MSMFCNLHTVVVVVVVVTAWLGVSAFTIALASCCVPILGSIPPGLEGGVSSATLTQSMETIDPLKI